VAAAPSFEDAVEHLRNGDFARANAAIEQADEAKPEQLAKRGELRWLTYLQKQRQANATIKPDDEPVKQAKADLEKASTPDALFWLGYIEEATGQTKKARDTYTKAVERYKNDPAQRRIFDAALERLDESEPAGAGAALPRGDANLLALLLIGLQQPNPMPPTPPGAPPAGQAGAAEDEAGFDFWRAMKMARELNYAGAVKELDKARAVHAQRRFARLRRAQNPLSDPTEEIFLRCCDELKRYWAMEARLSQDGYLKPADRRNPVQALDRVIAAAKEGAAGGAALKDAAAKLAQARVIDNPQDIGKGIDKLLADRQAAQTKAADLEARAKAAQAEAMAQADKAKAAEAKLTKADDALKGARKREDDLMASAAAAEGALKQAADELVAAKYLSAEEAKDPRAALPKGVAAAIRTASAADKSGALRRQEQTIAELRTEVARLRKARPQAVPSGPDGGPAPDPLAAEKHYAAGLNFYFARNYRSAEKEFLAAVENDGQDARFYYYLGLSRLLQNKRGAAKDFEQGAVLEARGRPAPAAVSASLERVQGPARRRVNEARTRPPEVVER
jgi:TolA-binding protein